jgi:hypothetical protein
MVDDLQLHQAVFGTEGTYVEGCLQVLNGAVDTALFRRCVDKFQLRVEPSSILDSPIPMIPFTACAIHFRLQPEGLDFWADNKWDNSAFMCYQKGHYSPPVLIVYLPTHRRPVSYLELMSIFAADTAPVVPLTTGLQPILPHIPIQDTAVELRNSPR